MNSEVPIYQKMNLTIAEACQLTNIGRDKLTDLTRRKDCDFVLRVGTKTLIKRKMLEKYLSNKSVI